MLKSTSSFVRRQEGAIEQNSRAFSNPARTACSCSILLTLAVFSSTAAQYNVTIPPGFSTLANHVAAADIQTLLGLPFPQILAVGTGRLLDSQAFDLRTFHKFTLDAFLRERCPDSQRFGCRLSAWQNKLQVATSSGMDDDALARRALGKTGSMVTLLGLGGEGILRTDGRTAKAVEVIERALDLGINYCDTAPAYASSRDYYGEALRERRAGVFLASKTHDRSRDGSLRLLDDSLSRLRTDYLDLWQLHDLRTKDDLDQVFAKGGALEALVRAREEKRVRFLGITGHHSPSILLEATRRFAFDTVLVALNAADVHRLSFIREVLPEAVRRGMGVIGMKVYSQGQLIGQGGITKADAMGYVLSLPAVSTIVIGCRTPAEVEENVRIARQFKPFADEHMQTLEERTRSDAERFTYYKMPRLP